MTPKQQRPRLQFQEIVRLWSYEPGQPARGEILERLLAAVWLGNFEDDAGVTCLTLDAVAEDDTSFNRRLLLTALRSSEETLRNIEIPAGAYIPDSHYGAAINRAKRARLPSGLKRWADKMAKPWASERDRVPWQKLAALRLDQYRPAFLETYIEPLCISKGDFQAWCSRHGTDPPEFWVAEAEGTQRRSKPNGKAKTSKRRGRTPGSGAYNDIKALEKMKELIDGETAKSHHQAAGMVVREKLVHVKGSGTEASIIKRLYTKYPAWAAK